MAYLIFTSGYVDCNTEEKGKSMGEVEFSVLSRHPWPRKELALGPFHDRWSRDMVFSGRKGKIVVSWNLRKKGWRSLDNDRIQA
jgi:hypothetical protein